MLEMVEIIPKVLYWKTGSKFEDHSCHYFNVDKIIKYKPIYSEYGPLNMHSIHKFCCNLNKILKQNPSKPIVHFT